ncbi:class I adenylate-forming enzyme family protein [Actinomadura physcomitrii]|uniref:class I adenylate-forming enzyme family protein n=1 Tax=Actinomadura physcomitrii TaxID=2650748 RepID=UPI0019242C6F|nr:class I adenylate-forming enzyme family protein [Actinomadura physcomitrii]
MISQLTGGPSAAVKELVVGDVLRRAARLGPTDAVLSVVEPAGSARTWTAAQLLRDAEAVAAGLLRDHTPGTAIATLLPNGAEAILLQLGAALAGLVLVPVNPRSRPAELEHALRLSGSVRLYAGAGLGREGTGKVEVVELDGGLDALPSAAAVELPDVAPGSLAQIQFTSGTSGRPKGVRIRHEGMALTGHAFAHRIGLPEGGVWVNPMPLFHTAGNVLGVMGALWQRAEHVVLPFEPAAVLRAVRDRRATLLSAAPTLLDLLMAHPGFRSADLASLRVVFTGGSTVTPARVEAIEARFGAPLAITFGMTETCGSALLTAPLTDPAEVRRTSVGRPLPGTEVRVVGAGGAVLPVGEPGELLVRGRRLTDGYHDDPEATARAIDADGWLHTGDLAVVDERRCVRIAGRLKDMIKTGGENVAPDEVEEVIAGHPEVARAAVVGVPDERWGELVVAFVVPAPGASPDTGRLDAHCRTRLSNFKVPRRWHLVDELPLTASSKVQRAELRNRAAAAEQPMGSSPDTA